ncbi:hypothetical protein GQ457_03G005170 [Hibiscus cannabinus]
MAVYQCSVGNDIRFNALLSHHVNNIFSFRNHPLLAISINQYIICDNIRLNALLSHCLNNIYNFTNHTLLAICVDQDIIGDNIKEEIQSLLQQPILTKTVNDGAISYNIRRRKRRVESREMPDSINE